MNENQIIFNNKAKFKLPLPISLGLLFKHMQNRKIPESILKIIELINISLFKFINQSKNNKKGTEVKLVYINNLITENLYKKSPAIKSCNLSAKTRKSNFNLTSIENNKNNTNPDIYEEINSCNINSNYLRLKVKNKIKNEHNKYKIKEMEYLQRIAELQSQINSYEKKLEKLVLENDELINYINDNMNIIAKNNMNRTNSADNLSIKDKENIKYFKIKNHKKKSIKNSNKIIKSQSLSDLFENDLIKNLKIDLKQDKQKENKLITIDSYMNTNLNKNKNTNIKMTYKPHYATSINNINFKYQVGNGYLRNNFVKLKKDIKDKTNHLKKIKSLLNDIK